MFYENLKGPIEALLFASGEPLAASKLAQILSIDELNVRELIDRLQFDLAASHRGLAIVEVAGGFQFCTKPEFAAYIEQLGQVQDAKLSAAALETLAIIAFRQPVTRQEVEQVRGVKAERIISQLVERGLIRELGRKDAIGRPILYGTTEGFLQSFGLRSLKELPDLTEFISEN
ncbi:MAG: SMC-Scp complex subunit ScpB, partial [Sporomusaceae bacterium]|nr:SMC-Scp complex subunit ScpB [Sporomusaceae bacterium]